MLGMQHMYFVVCVCSSQATDRIVYLVAMHAAQILAVFEHYAACSMAIALQVANGYTKLSKLKFPGCAAGS